MKEKKTTHLKPSLLLKRYERTKQLLHLKCLQLLRGCFKSSTLCRMMLKKNQHIQDKTENFSTKTTVFCSSKPHNRHTSALQHSPAFKHFSNFFGTRPRWQGVEPPVSPSIGSWPHKSRLHWLQEVVHNPCSAVVSGPTSQTSVRPPSVGARP
jgi:hypothetical protein